MVADYQTYVAFRCPQCGAVEIEQITLFHFSGGAKVVLSCDCGAECVTIVQAKEQFQLHVVCAACLETHTYSMRRQAFFSKLLTTFYCPNSQVGILSVGSEALVLTDMRRQDEAFEELFGEIGLSFLNDVAELESEQIMVQAIDRIHELASVGNVFCRCGSHDISFRINSDSLELVCELCGVSEHIAAANEEDLAALQSREYIVIKGKSPKPKPHKPPKLPDNFNLNP